MLRAAVIGLGVGFFHCRGYAKSKNAELVAVCNRGEDRLRKAREEFGKVDLYTDYKKLLNRDDIDVVSIATPSYLHSTMALEAIASGKHVFLEKPMAFTLEKCDEIIEAAKKNNVKITIDYEFRINPFWSEVKDFINKGEVGQIASAAVYHWRKPFNVKKGGWSQKSKYVGNLLFEEMVHWFDLLRWYGGEIKKIHCLANDWVRKEFDYDQNVFINFEYEDGGIGQVSQTINGFDMRTTLWVIGTEAAILGKAIYSDEGNWGERLFKPHQRDIPSDRDPKIVKKRKFGEEIYEMVSIEEHVRDFVDRIVEDRGPLVTGVGGRKTIELCLAAEKSARTGEVVKLPLEGSSDFAREN